MRILEVDLHTERRGMALVSRGQHLRKSWKSIEKNYTTNRWQLKQSNIDIHDRVIDLQTQKELREQFEKLSKRT